MNQEPAIPVEVAIEELSPRRRIQSYPEYRDSGAEWLGVVPATWGQKRLKFSAQLVSQKVEARSHDLPYVGMENIESHTGRLVGMDTETNADGLSNCFAAGDVLFGKLRPYLAKALHATMDGLCSSELLVYRPYSIAPRFLLYYMLSDGFVKQVNASTYGAKMPRASAELIGNLPLLIPSLGEQRAIAAFLDRQTTRIDELIAKKQRLIELLAEKRTALISHAVTNGLNPDTPMKDSGIDWLAQVPQHWHLKQLKFAVTFQRGHDLPSSERIEGTVPVVTSAGPSSWHDCAAAKGPGIVTGRYGTIGTFHLVEEDFWPLNTTLYSINLRGNVPRFLWYMLHLLSGVFLVNSTKSAVPGVDRNDLHPVTVAVPPASEQEAVVKYLDGQLRRYSELTNQVQAAIERLHEYRSALISAAVTGKIDVRGEA